MCLTRHAARAALAAAVLIASAATAAAAPAKKPKEPVPPDRMSSVGGELLSRPGTQVRPEKGAPALPEKLTGRSWIVADAESGEVLAAHNAHWRLAPASTLKMLFADTVLPKLDKDREHEVTLEELEGVQPGSSLVGVKEETTYTVHDLWLGVFLSSGNDAVHVLSAMNGGIEQTVAQMQRHAQELGARDTVVVSPDGFDSPGQVSSAYDLTLFARSGMQKPDFREYCATVDAKFPGAMPEKKGAKRESYEIQNTNRLLTGSFGVTPYKGLAGVKNGYTSGAGNTFTGVAQRGDRTLLVTVMHPEAGANDVYTESAALLDWGFAAAGKVRPVGELVPPEGAKGAAAKGAEKTPDAAAATAAGSGAAQAGGPQPDSASGGGSGKGTALALAAGALLLCGAVALLVHRLWPPGAVGPAPFRTGRRGAPSFPRERRRRPRLPRPPRN